MTGTAGLPVAAFGARRSEDRTTAAAVSRQLSGYRNNSGVQQRAAHGMHRSTSSVRA